MNPPSLKKEKEHLLLRAYLTLNSFLNYNKKRNLFEVAFFALGIVVASFCLLAKDITDSPTLCSLSGKV